MGIETTLRNIVAYAISPLGEDAIVNSMPASPNGNRGQYLDTAAHLMSIVHLESRLGDEGSQFLEILLLAGVLGELGHEDIATYWRNIHEFAGGLANLRDSANYGEEINGLRLVINRLGQDYEGANLQLRLLTYGAKELIRSKQKLDKPWISGEIAESAHQYVGLVNQRPTDEQVLSDREIAAVALTRALQDHGQTLNGENPVMTFISRYTNLNPEYLAQRAQEISPLASRTPQSPTETNSSQ